MTISPEITYLVLFGVVMFVGGFISGVSLMLYVSRKDENSL